MNNEISPAHSQRSLSQLVEKACRHWESRGKAAKGQHHIPPGTAHAFSIALAREAGAQGTAVAKEAARLLNWHVYDRELLEKIASDMGLQTTLLETVDEKHHSWLLETTHAFLSAPRPSDWGPLVTESSYVHHLIKTVLALGVHGECVIVGRGAAFILPAATTLRVRLVGPVKERITALSGQFNILEREAARKLRTIDRDRTDFVRDHFFKDAADPCNYDLILNSPRLSVTQNAEVIVATLRRLQAAQAETASARLTKA